MLALLIASSCHHHQFCLITASIATTATILFIDIRICFSDWRALCYPTLSRTVICGPCHGCLVPPPANTGVHPHVRGSALPTSSPAQLRPITLELCKQWHHKTRFLLM